MHSSNSKNRFVKQAGILAAAGIICRIIGVLYRSPLKHIIGAEGEGYYSTACNVYSMILLIASYSIPSALAKVLSQERELKRYKNSQKIFYCTFIYIVVIGGIASLFTFIFAGWLAEDAANVLRVFVPTIFLSGIVGVLRGYFQARNTMVFTSFSQIIEQVVNAVFSVAMAYIFMQLFADESIKSKALYGAAGSAFGTGAGVLAALIYMFIIYKKRYKYELEDIKSDTLGHVNSYKHIFKMIILLVTPYIFSTFIYNFSAFFNQTIFIKYMKYIKHLSGSAVSQIYGVFSVEALVIINVPVALAAAMATAIIPSISIAMAKNDTSDAKNKMDKAIKITMLIAIPCAIGLMTLSKPIVKLMFSTAEKLILMPGTTTVDLASKLIVLLGVTIIFTSLSTLNNAFLQAMGKPWIAMANAAIAFLVQAIIFFVMLSIVNLGVYSFVVASIVYSLLMCVLNEIAIRRTLNFKHRIKESYLLPLFAAVIMGISSKLIYMLFAFWAGNTISLILSLVTSVVVYFAMVILLGIASENEIIALPFGNKIIKIAELLKLHVNK